MSIRPIDHQISALNTVPEAKKQQNQQNKGHAINLSMQDNMQSEVQRNKSRVIQSDHAQGNKVDQDGSNRQQQEKKDRNNKKKNQELKKIEKEETKGNVFDIRI